MHMTEEQRNVMARAEIQELRGHLADALEAISKPGRDFDAALLAMSGAWFNLDRCGDLICEGRRRHEQS